MRLRIIIVLLIISVIGATLLWRVQFYSGRDTGRFNIQSKNEEPNNSNNLIEQQKEEPSPDIAPVKAKEIISSLADEVIKLIAAKDFENLANLVHPEKGIRFTPYTGINLKNNIVFPSGQVRDFFKNQTIYTWGMYAGTDDKYIKLTPSNYYNSFIYDADFKNAKKIGYNEIISIPSSYENQFEIYRNSIIVEYYVPGSDPEFGSFEWSSLRLVFQAKGEQWYLVGIIHNEWAI